MSEQIVTKNPIVETSVDIRCNYKLPSEALVGIIYSLLNESKSFQNLKVQGLPILKIPEQIRNSDINLKNSPTHKITTDSGIIAIGPRILSIGILPPYNSWKEFNNFVTTIIKEIEEADIIKGLENISIRYLNFFNYNIFEKIKLNFSIDNDRIENPSTIFRTEIEKEGNIVNVIQITGNVHIENSLLKIDDDGSLIDIRVISKSVNLQDLEQTLELIHKEVKDLFFKIISDDLGNKLKDNNYE